MGSLSPSLSVSCSFAIRSVNPSLFSQLIAPTANQRLSLTEGRLLRKMVQAIFKDIGFFAATFNMIFYDVFNHQLQGD